MGYALNNSFPSASESDLLTVTYYDDYSFPHGDDTEFQYQQELGNAANDTLTKTLVTGSMVKELDSNTWLKSITYYDVYGRVIQTIAHNIQGIRTAPPISWIRHHRLWTVGDRSPEGAKAGDQMQRTHGYLYDPANHLTGAAYIAKGATAWDQEDDYYI